MDSPAVPPQGRRVKQRVLIAGGAIVVTLSLIVAGVVGWAWYKIENRTTFAVPSLSPLRLALGTIATTTESTSTTTAPTTTSAPAPTGPPPYVPPPARVPPRSLTDGTNFLLVGIDNAAGLGAGDPVTNGRGQSANTDTMMILRVDNTTGRISLVSIPRDLYVPIAGTSDVDRINAARGYTNGRDRLVRTIRDALGVDLNHYIEVDFRGFKGVVNAIGGVPMNFDVAMRDAHTGLSVGPGCAVLNADMALALVRSRYLQTLGADGQWHYDPTSDYGRVVRQQQFLMNLARKAISEGVSNPITALQLISAFSSSVATSNTLSTDALVSLAVKLAHLGLDHVDTYTLATTQYAAPNGQGVLLLQADKAQPVISIFQGQVQPGAALPHGSGAKRPGALPAPTTSSTSSPATDTTAPAPAPAPATC